MNLIQTLPEGPLDIVGDIHGEYEALCNLLSHLGYDVDGNHPGGRTLVFVGDFCDRGPDSPAVLNLVARLVQAGRAFAVLGNHELNILRDDPKDGAGWYFAEREQRDQGRYAPFARLQGADKPGLLAFLGSLPLALERHDIRIVHAAWIADQIALVRPLKTTELVGCYEQWDVAAQEFASQLVTRMEHELQPWPHGFEDPAQQPPMMPAHAEHDAARQMMNPIRVVTSGVECQSSASFFAGGKWRFNQRVAWWDEYEDDVPVVMGHYWRRFASAGERPEHAVADENLFGDILPHSWHGKLGNVFCIDYSVGARWSVRKGNTLEQEHLKLAALRWPERILCLDDGQLMVTVPA